MATKNSSAGNLVLIIAVLAGTAVLCTLGFWQVQRLAWKEDLIATVESRRALPPVPLHEIESRFAEEPESIEFRPVSVSGEFRHEFEQYYYVTRDGQVGWHIYTPLVMDDGRVLYVNRGFLPDPLKDPAKREDGLVKGRQSFDGLARTAPDEKPNSFVPDNDPAGGIYYWKSLAAMKARLPEALSQKVLPFFVDAGANSNPGRWPEGGSTRIRFPNNHLQYAITWFGLALALLGVGSYFLYARMRRKDEASGESE